ncbi:aldo/keto reductase [Halorarius halobius]|uniref:aldo/keto reductase n=1 Tax=Halorarius halobius TaxID=2962671 RepID=UPI0020CE21FC|nr:aldo/keto reductase [Halorarius halobius]
MEYTTLGSTGIEVSRICLGCMSFGSPDWRDWVRGEEFGHDLVERAIDLGINFFDTANMYSRGESERVLGDALDGYDRDAQVVATKVFFEMRDSDPNSGGLSRKTIEQELDASLDRLGMETVDLYQTHRWDDDTPVETTLAALDDAVRRGKIRHYGASSMWAYQFATAQHTADREGYDRFVSMQDHYSLAYREEEREMHPYCRQEDVAVLPWSPLARGFLARPHEAYFSTERAETDDYAEAHPYADNGGREINERVEELADQKDVKMAQVALSWVLHQDAVTAPIVGASKVEHLEDAVEALDIDLSESDQEWLAEPYEPVPVSGHS